MPHEPYATGARVFLVDGPITLGVILPSPEGTAAQYRAVKLDGEEEPVILHTRRLTPATLTPGRRVFRHTGGPHRFGFIPTLGRTPPTFSKARMNADEESIVVRWDNNELEVVVKDHLTPIIYEASS